MSECNREASIMRRTWLTGGCGGMGGGDVSDRMVKSDCCEHDKEYLDSANGLKILDQLREYWFPLEESD